MEKNQGEKLRQAMPDLDKSEEVQQRLEEYEKKQNAETKKKLGNAALKLDVFLESKAQEVYSKETWKKEFTEASIIKPENITDKFWKNQEQFVRNEGRDMVFTEDMKKQIINGYQEDQRESLGKWLNYLEANVGEDKQYPEWFREYLLQSLPKMATFNKEKKQHNKRGPATVAPFPSLNPAALAEVYSTLEKNYTGELKDESDKDLFKNGNTPNFNRLYSKKLLESKNVIDTPERAEDIKGEWKIYENNPQELAEAAQGTPWCIASEDMAKRYQEDHGSTFHLFHLEDPETGKLSSSAAISVRTNSYDGKVVEISGLKDESNQFLEDSLVPTAYEKVKGMPGGENYIKAFKDKQKLIAMDKKFQNKEDFTLEELEFLYEINRPINYVDTYEEDPRPKQFKAISGTKHKIQLAEKYGESTKYLVMDGEEIIKSLNEIHESGMDINSIIHKISSDDIAENLSQLIEHGAEIDVNELVEELDPEDIVKSLSQLIEHGAEIDVNETIEELDPQDIAPHIDNLMKNGAEIDHLVGYLNDELTSQNILKLLDYGADANKMIGYIQDKFPETIVQNFLRLKEAGGETGIDEMIPKLSTKGIGENLNQLLDNGAKIDLVVPALSPADIADNLEMLFDHDAGIDQIVGGLDSKGIANNLESLLNRNAKIDQIVGGLGSYDINTNLEVLFNRKANIDQIVEKLYPHDIVKNLESLFDHEAKTDQIVKRLYSSDIADNLEVLFDHKANIDQIVKNLGSDDIDDNLEPLLNRKANIDQIVEKLRPHDIVKNLESLFNHEAKADQITKKLTSLDVAENLKSLLKHGAEIDVNALVKELESYQIANNLESLLKHGAEIGQIMEKLDSDHIAKKFSQLIEHGADIDIDALVEREGPYWVVKNLETLKKYGVEIDIPALIVNPYFLDLDRNLEPLLKYGADVNILIEKLSPSDIADNLELLKKYGAEIDINTLTAKLDFLVLRRNIEPLLKHGADANIFIKNFSPHSIVDNLEILLSSGADPDTIVAKLDGTNALIESYRK